MMTARQSVTPWTYFDYVEGNGNNQISAWLHAIPAGARDMFEALLDSIRPFRTLNRDTGTGKLDGDCDGLYEFIFKFEGVQYRPLFVYGPNNREITILVGATKTSRRRRTIWDPPEACDTAHRRYRNLQNETAKVVKHVRIR